MKLIYNIYNVLIVGSIQKTRKKSKLKGNYMYIAPILNDSQALVHRYLALPLKECIHVSGADLFRVEFSKRSDYRVLDVQTLISGFGTMSSF